LEIARPANIVRTGYASFHFARLPAPPIGGAGKGRQLNARIYYSVLTPENID